MTDIDANMRKVKLARFWDDIIEKYENHELPSDFQTRKKWIYVGNTYIRLVEPLDITYYYNYNLSLKETETLSFLMESHFVVKFFRNSLKRKKKLTVLKVTKVAQI